MAARAAREHVKTVMPRSIVGWFIVCWSSFVLAAVVAGGLLWSLYNQSTTEQLRRAAASIAHGCDAIVARYQLFITSAQAPLNLRDSALSQGLTNVLKNALRDLPGIEGGVWQTGQGSLAYAFPTYEGSGEKTDLPPAEEPQIREAAEAAALGGGAIDRRREGRSQTLLHACPLPGPMAHLAAWTMTRVATAGGAAYVQAMAGLSVLLILVLGSAIWLGRLLLGWSSRLKQLETALASSSEALPKLEPTGQRDLDRIVDAVNLAGARLADARHTADSLARQMAEAKRLASLGRVLAGVAHEIRNPIAAMRLKAENALAVGSEPERKGAPRHRHANRPSRKPAAQSPELRAARRAGNRPGSRTCAVSRGTRRTVPRASGGSWAHDRGPQLQRRRRVRSRAHRPGDRQFDPQRDPEHAGGRPHHVASGAIGGSARSVRGRHRKWSCGRRAGAIVRAVRHRTSGGDRARPRRGEDQLILSEVFSDVTALLFVQVIDEAHQFLKEFLDVQCCRYCSDQSELAGAPRARHAWGFATRLLPLRRTRLLFHPVQVHPSLVT